MVLQISSRYKSAYLTSKKSAGLSRSESQDKKNKRIMFYET